MTWVPDDNVAIVSWAVPFVSACAEPRLRPPSLNWTVPVGVPEPEVTVAVNVTDWPKSEGLTEEDKLRVGVALLTVMEAVAAGPRPPPLALVAPCTWKLNVLAGLDKFRAGVNRRPAPASALVIKLLLVIGVMPSFLNSVPFVMFVILKCVISAPSTAFRVITRPEVVFVLTEVDAFVTE